MTRTAQRPADRTIVAGRAFARTSVDGHLDGANERGIYAHDLRILRRAQVFRAEHEVGAAGDVVVDEDGCAVRFRLDRVEPGTGVLLVVELDGTDLFSVRDLVVDPPEGADGPGTGLGLGDARPDARVWLAVDCDGAELEDRDGVALSEVPVRVDGTARTASWRWTVDASEPAPVDVFLELRASWALSSDAQPAAPRPYDDVAVSGRALASEWLSSGRPVVGGSDAIGAVHQGVLEDLASLRLRVADGVVLGAGVPWYLTVFGRDSLLASWMALPVDPDLAVATLRHLARHQATGYDLSIDAEPGKVQHEERSGVAARRWHERYYGSVDSTPLFVMLLAEHARWTGSDELARELEDSARAAIGWILARVEEDELGLLSYWRRAERGLDVQSWKDSPDSQRDNTGKVASGLIRPLEAQAYAVAALRGAARLASSAWDDDVIGSEWSAAARLLERRLVERMLVELPPVRLSGPEDPRVGGYLAQAVDSVGLPVDSLCSNVGHVLWCEAIADPSLRARSVEQLTSDALDSGWGIRTMSTSDAGYAADGYHCGSVWPHDTAICVAGIARYDREAALRIGRALLDAASAVGGRLPEAFTGDARVPGEAPRVLDSACRPQAWASAAPLLVLRSLLGLEPDANGNELVAVPGTLPDWLHGFAWRGIHALGTRWDVEVGTDGIVDVVRAG
jgi:glycogen debranching enzyme